MRIIELDDINKKNILEDLLKRSPNQYKAYVDTVNKIISDVRMGGDKALNSLPRNSTL